MKGQQLALSVALSDPRDFSHFHAGPNQAVVQSVRALLDPADGSGVLLHGPEGSGKTHLVQALLAEARECDVPAVLIVPEELARPSRQHETIALLCFDGLHAPIDDAQSLGLIRLLDARRQRAVSTLVTAARPAAHLELARPDLVTRLSALASFGLKPLSDEDRTGLLRLRAATRGMSMSPEIASYLLKHLPRDIGTLLGAVDRLDQHSLETQRGLTIPFVQQTLGLGG